MGEKKQSKGHFIYIVVGFSTIGAILFGLDQGNWAGAIEKKGFVHNFCGDEPNCYEEPYPQKYTDFLSWGSSLVQLGAFAGALLLGPPIAGKCGRHEALFAGCAITIAGVIPMCITTNRYVFEAVRFITGGGVGIVTYALPMFISEVAPPAIRGLLGSSFQLLMVIGMFIASMLNALNGFGYRASFSLPLYPSIIICLGIFCFPVSPRFAVLKFERLGKSKEGERRALESLKKLRGSKTIAQEELNEIKASLATEESEAPWSTLFLDKSIFKRVLIANGLQWMQQFTGVNALLSFGPSMFKAAPVPFSPLVCQVIITVCNLIATCIMMAVIDTYGRRILLLVGAAAMFVFMTAAGIISVMIEEYNMLDGTGVALLVCLCGYMLSFGIGWGGVCWVYPSEIFPMDVKEKAMSTSVGSQWLANFIIAFLVPQQVAIMKKSGTFFFYSVCLAITFTIVYLAVPETKGLPLEDMDKLFGARKGRSDTSSVSSDSSDDSSSEEQTDMLQTCQC